MSARSGGASASAYDVLVLRYVTPSGHETLWSVLAG